MVLLLYIIVFKKYPIYIRYKKYLKFTWITLLCILCPSANVFSAVSKKYFYFLPGQAQIHLDHWKVLDELWC